MPRIVPSWIGSSYFLPVRLSTTVSVSLIRIGGSGERAPEPASVRIVVASVGVGCWFPSYPVRTIGPPCQVLNLAALATERPPRRIDGLPAAVRAYRRLARYSLCHLGRDALFYSSVEIWSLAAFGGVVAD